uniref:Uncharacterized protein n=1 Tax=Cyclophora tenuis TaxID=216820 RepID=A0A7S1DCQ8_CYCTE
MCADADADDGLDCYLLGLERRISGVGKNERSESIYIQDCGEINKQASNLVVVIVIVCVCVFVCGSYYCYDYHSIIRAMQMHACNFISYNLYISHYPLFWRQG